MTAPDAMHTSAPAACAQYTGTLLAPGQCRMRPIDADGHMVPVLLLDVQLDNALHTRLRVEQPFAPDAQAACEAAARRHRAGERVRVDAPLAGLRLIATHAQHVRVLPSTPTPTTP